MSPGLSIEQTAIPGLLVVRLPLHADVRGWFKENWQREKMLALGLPDFEPVQHNISYNNQRGATRGIHAEPWDKFVSVATGRVFGAWVDLRNRDSFGTVFHLEIDPSIAVFVPRGVGNAYQALADDTAYSYLVNDHRRAGVDYPALDLADPTVAIPWPIPLDRAELSDRDLDNPRLESVAPMPPKRTLITGAGGQLGRALAAGLPDARAVTRSELDISDPDAVAAWPWHDYDLVINAAAYTDVDAAETDEGRRQAWAANAAGPAALAQAATLHRLTLVHFSSDYVFDGSLEQHREDEPLSPLGVYGQSKAAGDLAIVTTPRHYVIRTSWVVGEGANFVRTMHRLAREGKAPTVVADQHGRLTFTDELARAVRHVLEQQAPFGTYNVTNAGKPMTWAGVAREVFRLSGRDPRDIRGTSTEEHAAGRHVAPRPRHSTLDLAKIRQTGFEPEDAGERLARQLSWMK